MGRPLFFLQVGPLFFSFTYPRFALRAAVVLFFLFVTAGSALASCRVLLVKEVSYAPEESEKPNDPAISLEDYANRVVELDLDIVVIFPSLSNCEQNNSCKINERRIGGIKKFLVTKGLTEKKIFTFDDSKTNVAPADANTIVIESIGFDRRCLTRERESVR